VEIAPVPHRANGGEYQRLALGLLVLVPVVLLVLLPTVLGLDRYVVTDRAMGGALGRGSVVLAREVPPSDLEVGDVISFRRPGGSSDERVVRRIVSIDGGVATTAGDNGSTEHLTVRLDAPAYHRVWLGVPWLGYPFVLDGGWLLLSAVAVAAFGLALVAGRRQRPRVAGESRARLPVG
jgi:signal peptidase I